MLAAHELHSYWRDNHALGNHVVLWNFVEHLAFAVGSCSSIPWIRTYTVSTITVVHMDPGSEHFAKQRQNIMIQPTQASLGHESQIKDGPSHTRGTAGWDMV